MARQAEVPTREAINTRYGRFASAKELYEKTATIDTSAFPEAVQDLVLAGKRSYYNDMAANRDKIISWTARFLQAISIRDTMRGSNDFADIVAKVATMFPEDAKEASALFALLNVSDDENEEAK